MSCNKKGDKILQPICVFCLRFKYFTAGKPFQVNRNGVSYMLACKGKLKCENCKCPPFECEHYLR